MILSVTDEPTDIQHQHRRYCCVDRCLLTSHERASRYIRMLSSDTQKVKQFLFRKKSRSITELRKFNMSM